jgi:hypothetical protein
MKEISVPHADIEPGAIGVVAGVVLAGAGVVTLIYPPARQAVGTLVLRLLPAGI